MTLRLVSFPVAGGGGREVMVNPEQIVCVLDVGGERAQIVTTGLSGETSMSLIVERPAELVARDLVGTAQLRGASAKKSLPAGLSRTISQ